MKHWLLSSLALVSLLTAGPGGVLALVLALGPAAPVAAAGLTGAIFTSAAECDGTNVNTFAAKTDVYLNGGPAQDGAAGLPNGWYYVQVTEPDGTLLGSSGALAPVQVDGGRFAQCYQVTALVSSASTGQPGFDTTGNPAGVYKVWVSTDRTFPPSESKTDTFKVAADAGTDPEDPARLRVVKFYDANANGLDDDGQPIAGWKVRIQGVGNSTDLTRLTPVDQMLAAGNYNVSEFLPVETNWLATTPNPVAVALANGDDKTVAFGNVCLGAGGGLTLGFWSNRNGRAMVGDDDLALLGGLHLRNADGLDFDPADYDALRAWLLDATATNMAYMLSAQLAAMELSVFNGKVGGTALVYAPGATSANALGFTTVNALMAEANAELGNHGLTLDGSPYRAYQEALKNALDNANNNHSFVQATPCVFTFGS